MKIQSNDKDRYLTMTSENQEDVLKIGRISAFLNIKVENSEPVVNDQKTITVGYKEIVFALARIN